MKYLLLFPPAWTQVSPHLAIPTLLGQLKKEGSNAEAMDLNIEFFDDILKKRYLEKTIKNLNKIQFEVDLEAKKYDLTNKKAEDYPIEVQEILLKDKIIKEYLKNNSHLLQIIPNQIEKAVSNLKKTRHFYDPKTFITSSKTIKSALEIASLPYAPTKILFSLYENPLFQLNYDSVKYHVFSTSTNIFIEYFKKWLPIIQKKKPQYIGISITSAEQLVAGLTLANLLKTHTNAHINIGGNYFSRIVEDVVKHLEFFDLFADSISVDEGEKPIVELAKYIDNKIQIEEVPNLIYKKNDEVIVNKKCTPLKLNETAIPSYEGFKFSKYITPKIVLPIQMSRGCYWGKCTFCDISYGEKYSEKDLDALIKEFKEYKKKYGIDHFEIIDESIHPKYFEKIAEKIIENKLKINYQSCVRTEKGFTEEILKKARKSGFRMALWGLESGSKRIMELMNKGVDIDNRLEILQNASNADIWNHSFIIFGFPSETVDEAQETIDMVAKNSNIINSCGISTFGLSKHSKIKENPEYYKIISIDSENKEFSTALKFEAEGMNEEELNSFRRLIGETTKEVHNLPLWHYLSCWEYLFLYVSHYSVTEIKNYKLDAKINNS